jgi:hypothetical protein
MPTRDELIGIGFGLVAVLAAGISWIGFGLLMIGGTK